MSDFEWRGRARVIGFFDLVVSIVLLSIVAIFGIAIGTAISRGDENNSTDSTDSGVSDGTTSATNTERNKKILIGKIILWVLFASLSAHLLVQLWCSFKLLKATKIGVDTDKAYGLAKFWRTANIVFFVVTLIEISIIGFLTGTTTRFFIGMIGVILLRLGFLSIVHLYVEEL